MIGEKAKASDYEAICHELGFIPQSHFVEITKAGTIGFTCGKPEEVNDLLASVIEHGYIPTKSLLRNAGNGTRHWALAKLAKRQEG